ncbi:MAG: helix-turn-helix domain-containing protein, partial [Chitinophagaceae bacterium]
CFLFLSALYIVPWMTGFAGWYDAQGSIYREILFYTPFVQGLFMGPLLYFYGKSITNARFKWSKTDIWHFLPGILYLVWCFIVVITDKLIVGNYYLMDGEQDPDFAGWYQWLQKISIIIYLYFSVKGFKKYKQYTLQELSFADKAAFTWLQHFLIAFAIITALPLVQELVWLIPAVQKKQYISSWYYFMAFSVVVYFIAFNGYHLQNIPFNKVTFEPDKTFDANAVISDNSVDDTLNNSNNDSTNAEINEWMQKLTTAMETYKWFENPELTLSLLAKHIQLPPAFLSKLINNGFQKNFNDFVNDFRVNSLITKLQAGEHQQQTLLGLAYDAGFNSKPTFNRAFKKKTGLTPKEWLQKNSNN